MTLEIFGDDAGYLRGVRQRPVRPKRTVGVVDLFSGCGGLSLGIEAAASQLGFGTEVRLAAELDPRVAAVFADNFHLPKERLRRSVRGCFDRSPGGAVSMAERTTRTLVGAEVAFLVGGPPCQGHSSLNNHTRGDDPKNKLYLAMVRAAEVLLPQAVLIENVPAIERDRHGIVDRSRALLEKLGYATATAIVSLADIGVPQRRHRHVLFALANGAPNIESALEGARVPESRDLRWAIRDLKGRRSTTLDDAAELSAANQKRAAHLLRTGAFDLPNRLRPPCQRGPHKYKSMYGRLRWNEPAQTITSGFGSPGQGRYLHPDQLRTITPHEAARLQFFPDWFDFSALEHRRDLARAIGNAVPPKLAFVLAHHVLADQQCRSPRPVVATYAPPRAYEFDGSLATTSVAVTRSSAGRSSARTASVAVR